MTENAVHHASETAERAHHVNQWVMHHVTDSGEWHTPLWSLHLPTWISNNAVMLLITCFFLIVGKGEAAYRTDVDAGIALNALVGGKDCFYIAVQATLCL